MNSGGDRFYIRDEREFLRSVASSQILDPGERISMHEADMPRFTIMDKDAPLPVKRSLHIGPLNNNPAELQVILDPGNSFSDVEVIAALTELVAQFRALPEITFVTQFTNANTVLVGMKIIFNRESNELRILNV